VNLQGRPREEPEVNLTSLIDVVLLLLVFFMVSTSFVREADLQVKLPQASTESEPVVNDVERLVLVVTADGDYRVNDRELVNSRPETLRDAIRKTVGDDRALPVVLRADGRASHQSVVTAMDVLGKMGFDRISIATVNEQDGS
jgi:biopolymer transport protein ExbD